MDAFTEDEDNQMISMQQQRKKMRMNTKSAYIRRGKVFRDNYLRPIQSYKVLTPQYKKSIKRIDSENGDNEQKDADKIMKQSGLNGFCFNENNDTISSSNSNGFGQHKVMKEDSQETSENVVMNNDDNKPLKRKKKQIKRSPLKAKNHHNNNANKINTKQLKKNDNDEDDDDDDDLKKKKEKSPKNDKINDETIKEKSPKREQ